MAETVHVILTDYGDQFGWGVTSPQLPELVGGASTREALEAELPDLLRFGGAESGSRAELHYQQYYVTPDGREFAIRVSQRESELRIVLAQRLSNAFSIPAQLESLLDAPTSVTGEITFICCLPADRLEWVADQVDDSDAVVVVAPVTPMQIATLPIATSDESLPSGPRRTLADMGLSVESTVAELLAVTPMHDASGGRPGPVDDGVSARDLVLISA